MSLPSNIAEGKGRHSAKELLLFLYRARGSLLELVTQVEIARDLEYLDRNAFDHLDAMSAEVGKLLSGLINRSQGEIERAS